jgi:hypothetical protein
MKNLHYKLAAVATTYLMSTGVASANDLAGLGSNIKRQFGDLGGVAQVIFVFLGFVLVGLGVWGLATRKDNPQKPVSHSIWFILGGSFLLILTLILNMVTQSTFGANAGGLNSIGIQ